MADVDIQQLGDTLHRLAKIALDSGEAPSIEAALDLFRGYALHLETGPQIADDVSQQAALLTAANAGRRAFLGGVTVRGADGIPCRLPGWAGIDLSVVLASLGVTAGHPTEGAPVLQIGGGPAHPGAVLRTVTHDWSGGCVPASEDVPHDPAAFVLAGVVAGALGVCELFQKLRGSNMAAGRRSVGLSLWDLAADWREAARIPPIANLPSEVWVIGLGNLGQAFLWSLGMLPYADPSAVMLTLQDFDRIAVSNDSTSLLTSLEFIGEMKTRAMAAWAERRGFGTRLVERRFASDFHISPDDPVVALCGVDNALARASLEDAGFECVLEAGLGAGVSDFLAIRAHSFPQERRAREIWSGANATSAPSLDQPAYRDLAAGGADRCGLVRLAGRTVGAPFVGAVAGAMTIADLVRLANGATITAVGDFHLRSLEHRTVVPQPQPFGCNPGITLSG